MLKAFQKNVSVLVANSVQQKFLVAVSGGIDSMTMATLFKNSGYTFALAHCNFNLRGKESDGDEAFVKAWAAQYKTDCFTERFNTKQYAARHKMSIQMAARELRYSWLNKLREQHKFNFIAIAHNSDDAIETFFINLMRGTGIAGLHGIAAKQEHVIRPLLIFPRKEIEEYAKKINLTWREDSSNATDKYERNKIRHRFIPLLEEINPHARRAIHSTIENLCSVEHIYHTAIGAAIKRIAHSKNGKTYLSIPHLKKLPLQTVYVYEIIRQYGFNYMQARNIIAALSRQAGKFFLSPTHRLSKDRNYLIIEALSENKHTYKAIKKTNKLNVGTFSLNFSTRTTPPKFKPPVSSSIACLDYNLLKFPLTVRKWGSGDRFYPLGMNKPKKVSDFLIDSKVPLSEKDNIYVLLSGKEIAWVIGKRIDERYKIMQTTKKLYICKIDYSKNL